MKLIVIFVIFIECLSIASGDDTDYSNVNPDGSYAFGYSNSDAGSHYHTASGNPKVAVRGQFGARSPANGKVEETVYTAGPRGYRARGPNIHRKQDLSQVPRGPIGSPDDPLADPYDDPSYQFGFKTNNYQRREEADGLGRVDGQYSYTDDVGEKHSVKYKASSDNGFEVENGVPDSPQNVRYNNPLYKAHPQTRGHISFEKGPQGTYKFITSGPDQRRAETTGPDGVTRGSYSYLDDKGVQRSVQYIAGAGIGYRVVQSTVGPGTHIAANSDVPDYSIKSVSNDITGPDDGNYNTGPSGGGAVTPFSPPPTSYPSSTPSYHHSPSAYPVSPSPYPPMPYPPAGPPDYNPTPRPFAKPAYGSTPNSVEDGYGPTAANYPSGPSGPSGPSSYGSSGTSGSDKHIVPAGPTYPTYPSSSGPTYPTYNHNPSSTTSPDHRIYNDRLDSTIIKNKGKEWYFGIPPGGTIRAHIQNIDLIPVHERAISPSEALKRDEETEARNNL